MLKLKKINKVIVLIFFSLLAGCATTTAQPSLTPTQQKQIQKINAMQARWRDDDMANYAREPQGYQAWQQLNYP